MSRHGNILAMCGNIAYHQVRALSGTLKT